MSEIETLVKMANQIAANFSFHDDAEDRLTEHLQKFWAPALKRQLVDYVEAGGAGLDETVRQSARRLSV